MNLHSPEFEKRLRRRVCVEIRASPGLRREAKRLKRRRASTFGDSGGHLVAMTLLAFIVLSASVDLPAKLMFGVVALWGVGCAFNLANRLLTTLYGAPDLPLLAYHPISDQTVFDWQWAKCRRFSFWYLADFGVAYAMIAGLTYHTQQAWLTVPVLAVVGWLTVLALAAFMAAYFPSWLRFPLGLPVFGTLFLVALSWSSLPASLQDWIQESSGFVGVVLPTGWLGHAIRHGLAEGWTIHFLILVPAAAVVMLLKPARNRLRTRYQFLSLEHGSVSSAVIQPAGMAGEHLDESSAAFLPGRSVPPTTSVSEIEEGISNRSFLDALNWSQLGFLERIGSRWLSPRERLIAESMSAGVPCWTALWRRGGKMLLWVSVLTLLLAQGVREAGKWVLIYGGILAGIHVVPLGSVLSRTFFSHVQGGVKLAFHAGFPVGFREIARASLMVSFIRWVAAIPLVLAYAALLGWYLARNPVAGIGVGVRGLLLVLVTQPAIVALQFSSGTADTARVTLRTLFWVSLAVLCGLIYAGLCFAVFLAASQLTVGICLLLNAGFAYGFGAFYAWQLNRNRFDLIQIQR